MLFPFTRVWTRRQKAFIVTFVILGLASFAALIYGYERYYRGPGQEIFHGAWKGSLDWHGSEYWFQFYADHTFSFWDRAWFDPADSKPALITKGRWYAGGRFLYLRYPSTFRPDGPALQLWHIEDVSRDELRLRLWSDGGVHVFHHVDAVATNASNQAMQRTAGRSAFPLSMPSTFNLQPHAPSPAVADLVSR